MLFRKPKHLKVHHWSTKSYNRGRMLVEVGTNLKNSRPFDVQVATRNLCESNKEFPLRLTEYDTVMINTTLAKSESNLSDPVVIVVQRTRRQPQLETEEKVRFSTNVETPRVVAGVVMLAAGDEEINTRTHCQCPDLITKSIYLQRGVNMNSSWTRNEHNPRILTSLLVFLERAWYIRTDSSSLGKPWSNSSKSACTSRTLST